METVFDTIRWVHIGLGFTGLVAFWIPAFARKGGRTHVRVGRVFEWCAYFVAGSAVFNSLGRLLGAVLGGASLENNRESFGFLIFLAYLGLVTFATVRHAVRSVRFKKDFAGLRTPFHFALAVACTVGSLIVFLFAVLVWSNLSVVLLALSPIGVGQGVQMIRQMTRRPSVRMAWFYAHMGNMIGAGIAFHTAFAVFGLSRFITLELPGLWQIVPWVLPAAIGVPVNRILETRYRKKFGEPRSRRRKGRGGKAPATA